MASILIGILSVVSFLMVFLIMLQESKGGGLAALGGTKAAAIEGVTNPIRRATVVMSVIFFLLAIGLGISNRPRPSSIPFDEDKPLIDLPATGMTNPTPSEPLAVPPVNLQAQPATVTPGTLPGTVSTPATRATTDLAPGAATPPAPVSITPTVTTTPPTPAAPATVTPEKVTTPATPEKPAAPADPVKK